MEKDLELLSLTGSSESKAPLEPERTGGRTATSLEDSPADDKKKSCPDG